MTTPLNVNFERVQKILQRLKPLTQKYNLLLDTGNRDKREAELVERMNTLTAQPELIGTELVDTARELQALRNNRDKHAQQLAEVETTIGKLKHLLMNELEAIDLNESPATVEEFNL